MIEIEVEEPKTSVCECCGNTKVALTRFVYMDGDAYAVYFASFTEGHDNRRLSGLVGLGEWGEGGSPEDRVAFPFEMWIEQDTFKVGLTTAADSPWRHVTLLGPILGREEALKHERINEVFHITDHMIREDKDVVTYFRAQDA